jgi:hypothetical protein
MKIIITENQLKILILKEQSEEKLETPPKNSDECAPKSPKQWNKVNYTLDDVKNGSIIKFGDSDSKEGNAIKLLQTRLNDYEYDSEPDGKYGKGMLKQLSHFLDIDLCKQKNNTIGVGPNALKLLDMSFEITPEMEEDYLLATTLVGENVKGTQKELNAILSTIKNRIKHCTNLKSMTDVLSIGGQYSTLNHYNTLNDEEKKVELYNRVLRQKLSPKYNDFGGMFKKVQSFRKTTPLSYNHYFTNTLANNARKGTYNTDVAKSYMKNVKSSNSIGDHTFWWDDKHRCK